MHEETPLEGQEALELRHPAAPTHIDQLAALSGSRGKEIVQARAEIFEALRIASIRLTMPTDWVLFKNRDTGQVQGYLEDQGCDRIKKLWGIQIFNLSPMELIEDLGAQDEYAYRITADGRCGMTGEHVFEMEGIRYSTDDYARQKSGIQRRVAVQKAARANLDGSITRELAGMKSVPIEELDKAWEGSWKKSSLCNKGRGFGTADERVGGAGSSGVDPADVPVCAVCEERGKKGVKLVYRAKGQNGPFWGCPNYQTHIEKPYTVDDAKLRREIEQRKKPAGAA